MIDHITVDVQGYEEAKDGVYESSIFTLMAEPLWEGLNGDPVPAEKLFVHIFVPDRQVKFRIGDLERALAVLRHAAATERGP